eukprot:1180106-Amphidinium_carterae.2
MKRALIHNQIGVFRHSIDVAWKLASSATVQQLLAASTNRTLLTRALIELHVQAQASHLLREIVRVKVTADQFSLGMGEGLVCWVSFSELEPPLKGTY